jgi:hypothetical protein
MERENEPALVELGIASVATEGHGIEVVEALGLMPKMGISED